MRVYIWLLSKLIVLTECDDTVVLHYLNSKPYGQMLLKKA